MTEPTLDGLSARLDGMEKLWDNCMKNLNEKVEAVKQAIDDLKSNDLEHLRLDIEALKKSFWKLSGGLVVVWALVQLGVKLLGK